MLWAMCCLALFGFLRVSEFTIPGEASFSPTCHLSLKDVAIDNREDPRLLQVAIKQSKTDPFRRGVDIYLAYLALRGCQASPLFITQQGKGITCLAFSSALDPLLSKLQLNHKHYNTHSFRTGAGTSATQAQIPDSQIKMLGCW